MASLGLALVRSLGPAPQSAPSKEAEPQPEAAQVEMLREENARLEDQANRLRDEQRENEAKLDELQRENQALRDEQRRRDEKLDEVARRQEELSQKVETLEEEQKFDRRRLSSLFDVGLGGYLDVGFFWVAGDGSGIRPDVGSISFPEYTDAVYDAWVFMGDPLSTAINSRGEPADTGPSRAIAFDPIDAGNNPTLIVNALNLYPHAAIGEQFAVDALIDFLPRSRDISDENGSFLGDYVDIKLAQVRWIAPSRRFDLDVFAGKIDSVFGREYREQEAPVRTTVTPSLLCRYTCGRPVGLASRWKFLNSRALSANVSVTNGSTVQEIFGFSNEIDTNAFKTVTSRVAYEFPVGAGLEIGASGELGAQDLQPSEGQLHWQYGADLRLVIRGLELTAEFVQVRIQGKTARGRQRCGEAPCLQAMGAYGLLGYHITRWMMPYVRTDWRDALHEGGASFVYIAKLVRVTSGLRFDVDPHVAIKAEYTFNGALGRIPQFHNDVFTSSLVARF